jgi:hypothetical protein
MGKIELILIVSAHPEKGYPGKKGIRVMPALLQGKRACNSRHNLTMRYVDKHDNHLLEINNQP